MVSLVDGFKVLVITPILLNLLHFFEYIKPFSYMWDLKAYIEVSEKWSENVWVSVQDLEGRPMLHLHGYKQDW